METPKFRSQSQNFSGLDLLFNEGSLIPYAVFQVGTESLWGRPQAASIALGSDRAAPHAAVLRRARRMGSSLPHYRCLCLWGGTPQETPVGESF